MITGEEMQELEKMPKYSLEKFITYAKLHYDDQELLAILFELRVSMQKRVDAYNDECFKVVNEGTEEEDEEFDEGVYNSMVTTLQAGAKEVLVNELDWGISENGWNPDLLKELNIQI